MSKELLNILKLIIFGVALVAWPGFVLADVRISEIAWMGTDASNNDEWIELHNSSGESMDLDGWTLTAQDGSPSINLTGVIDMAGFYLLERSDDETVPAVSADLIYSGALGNSGEVLELRNASGTVIDIVNMNSEWTCGDNDAKLVCVWGGASWFTGTGTPASENVIEVEDMSTTSPEDDLEYEDDDLSVEEATDTENSPQSSVQPTEKSYLLGDVVINEFVSDPADDDVEWVELFNNAPEDISLDSWSIEEGSGKQTSLEGLIYSKKYYVIEKPKGNLNNKGDIIILRDGNENLIDQVVYGNWDDGQEDDNAPVAKDPLSIARKIDGYTSYNNSFDFVETESPTKDAGNIITNKETQDDLSVDEEQQLDDNNNATSSGMVEDEQRIDFFYPEKIEALIPASFKSTTTNIDLVGIKYHWNFGDGIELSLPNPEHTFLLPGEYDVQLIITTETEEYKVNKKIIVTGDQESNNATNENIIINEILPNPYGSDYDGEWVEIYNSTGAAVNLSNWQLDDSAGGSKPYVFTDDIMIDPGDFFLISREDTGIAMNNLDDEVVLFNEDGEIVDRVEYIETQEGESFARMENGDWSWSEYITPGEKNSLPIDGEQSIEEVELIFSSVEPMSEDVNMHIPRIIYFDDIETLEKGEYVLIEGHVAVMPGILGSQYFYIVDKEDSNGVQIYSHKKKFPQMNIGDLVEIIGEVSEINGEKRIKISEMNNIRVLGHGTSITPEKIVCEDINETQAGRLVEVEGEIVEVKGSSVFLDDGIDEVKIFVKKTTDIDKSVFVEGDTFSVVGIVSLSRSGVRILPRSIDDILVKNKAEEKTQEEASGESRVLGETIEADEWGLEKRGNGERIIKYALVIFASSMAIIILFIKKKKKYQDKIVT